MAKTPSDASTWRRWGWIPPLAALAVFLPALGHGFLAYDDPLLLTQNRLVQHASWSHALRILSGPLAGDYQPLPHLTYMLEWALVGARPALYHATNVCLHALSAALCVPLLAPVLGSRGALAAGVLFAVHPLAVEPVAWIASRKDVLMLPLLLGAVLAARRGQDRPRWALASLLLAALALLAKSSAVVVPFLVAWDAWWSGRGDALRRRAPLVAGHTLLAIGATALKLFALQRVGAAPALAPEGGAWVQLDLVGLSLGTFVGHAVWPVGLHLRYDPERVTPALHGLAWAAVLVLPWVVWACRQRLPGLVYGAVWFVLALLPAAQLIVFPIWVADRYAYAALPGFAAGVVCLCGLWRGRGLVLLALIAGAWTWLSSAQLHAWRDTEVLWAETLRRDPGNRVAPTGLARARLVRARALPQPERESLRAEATALLEATTRDQPDNPRPYLLLGALALERGHPAAAERFFSGEAGGIRARVSLADVYLRTGRQAEAVAELEAELAEYPYRAEANERLAALRWAEGRVEEARGLLERAVAAEPGRVGAWVMLALAHQAGGDVPAGRAALRRALDLGADRVKLQGDPRLVSLW
jgi:tetratricopeptide (TPR) repeat protein